MGSEMCIRDRGPPAQKGKLHSSTAAPMAAALLFAAWLGPIDKFRPCIGKGTTSDEYCDRNCNSDQQRGMHQPANSCANSPVLDLFRTIDSSSHLNSIPTYLATRLGTYEQVRRLLARHNCSSLEKVPHLWVRMHRQAYISKRRSPDKGREE